MEAVEATVSLEAFLATYLFGFASGAATIIIIAWLMFQKKQQ